MSSFFGSDGSFVLQFAVIFAVILAVLTAGVLLVRRLGGGGGGLSAKPGQRSRQPRLGIVDVYELDRARQLILLRRDNVEHLLLVGGPNDVVIERNIQRGQRMPEQVLREERAPEPVEVQASAIEARRPEPQLFEEVPPSFDMPAVVAAPVPGSILPPPSRHPLAEADIPPEPLDDQEPVAPAPAEPEPAAPPTPAPAPAAQSSAPETRSRFLRRSTPTLVNPKPDVASERVRSEPTFTITRATPPQPAAAPPISSLPVAPPPVLAPAQRTVDAAILSDMARQLEIALSRPASAVTPPPGTARPSPLVVAASAAQEEAPTQEEPPAQEAAAIAPAESQAVDPIAAAMSGATPPARSPEPEEINDTLFDEIVPVEEISPPPVAAGPGPEPFMPEPPPASAEAPAPEPEPTRSVADAAPPAAEAPPAPVQVEPIRVKTPAPAEPAPAAQPEVQETAKEAPKPAKSAAPNPFSVEEIEAEFARLLGRPLEKRN